MGIQLMDHLLLLLNGGVPVGRLSLFPSVGAAPLGCTGLPPQLCACGGAAELKDACWCLWTQVLQPVVKSHGASAAACLLLAVPTWGKPGSGYCLSHIFDFCLLLQAFLLL